VVAVPQAAIVRPRLNLVVLAQEARAAPTLGILKTPALREQPGKETMAETLVTIHRQILYQTQQAAVAVEQAQLVALAHRN